MTTSNATTVDSTLAKTPEKAHEKLAEKRRALGRGLESLLPGPRAVAAPPAFPQNTRKDGTPASSSLPDSSSQGIGLTPSAGGRAGTPVAPLAGGVEELQGAAGERVYVDAEYRVPIEQVDENPYQTRKEFDEGLLEELADSIREQGVLQPIMVRPGKDGRFILILGERRLRASRMAGKTTVPVIVKRVSEQQAAEMTLVENLQRQDLGCLEQAAAFANLSTEFRLTQEEIGKRVGVSREQVSNYLRLLKLPTDVLAALRKGELTYSHARLLLSLQDDHQISKVAQMVISEKMSVARLEDVVLDVKVPGSGSEERKQGERGGWIQT